MKYISNIGKLAAVVAIAVLPVFAGCSKEEVKEGIDTSKKATIEVTEEEEKTKPSVGIVE